MNITVTCEHATPLGIAVKAIRQCYESFENSDSIEAGEHGNAFFKLGEKDKALIERIIATGHTSTLEHISYNFNVKGISRLVLQELARHRIASYSVKSTRYTLKELKAEKSFIDFENGCNFDYPRIEKYINLIGRDAIDEASIYALNNLRQLIECGEYTNDEVKYALPECYKLDLYMTFNARSFQNFMTLRDSDKAHFEIQELAQKTFASIPVEHRFMYKVRTQP